MIKTATLVSDDQNLLRVTTNYEEDMLSLDAGRLGASHLECVRFTLASKDAQQPVHAHQERDTA